MPQTNRSSLAAVHAAALAALLSFAPPAAAQFKYPDCPDYKADEFKYVRLINRASDPTLREPVRMDFVYRGEGKSDIYFAERHGKIKRWDAVTNEMTVLGELDVWSDDSTKPDAEGSETGLNGLALDPGFKDNGRIWIFYSPYKDSVYRISHFTVKDGKLDKSSEKIILDIPEGRRHVSAITIGGGPMEFDSDGNLYIALGANSEQYPSVDERIRKRSAEASSANLADLRGSILRIRPDNSEKGYSIPKGNLAEHWAAEFEKQGKSSLAQEYANPAKVRPEIYVKGTRNPYSLNIDPKTGWMVWGDFGPTQQRSEEINLHTRPGYAGYPYWAGRNLFVLDQVQPWGSAGMDPKAPVNKSVWNTGPRDLPPAEPSVLAFTHEEPTSAMLRDGYPTTGPIYRYDGELNSHVKFPPHFEGAWFVVGRVGGLRVYRPNAAGDGVTDSAIFKGAKDEPGPFWNRPIELKQGPDGALYMLEYHGYHETNNLTHIGRYEYTGSCKPGIVTSVRKTTGPKAQVHVTARSIRIDEPGTHVLRVRTVQGKEVATLAGDGPREYPLALPGRGNLYIVTLEPGRGTWMVPGL